MTEQTSAHQSAEPAIRSFDKSIGWDFVDGGRTEIALPVGTVTLLMADVEGSTTLWEKDSAAMPAVIQVLDDLVAKSVGENQGVLPKDQGEGDSFVAAFSRPSDAVKAALEIQLGLAELGSPLKVRMSLHTGELQLRGDSNYVGRAINRASRIRSLAHGGQSLVSQSTYELAVEQLPDGAYLEDRGVHRLKDLARPEHLYELRHPQLPSAFPPLKSLDAVPNNLPTQLTTFIGRGEQLEELQNRLTSSRLITLTGSGGSGKTRLALQLGAEVLEKFQDGVWFVDLAKINSDDEIVPTLSSALGVQGLEIDRLIPYLSQRVALVILDNCEHLLGSCADLVSKLLEASSVTLITTSREPLGVSGEVTWRVPSLEVPNPGESLAPESLTQFEAVQLFIDRALKARHNFSVTNQNAAQVADICQRLDGIPLAIELAAARVRVLSAQQILEGLADQFRLLTGGPRALMPRQQTLEASIEWSYRLLIETEKLVLNRLAIFIGGFKLDAAEAVVHDGKIQQHEILDLVSQLVDKSLVQMEEVGGSARYRLLDSIRHFALKNLVASDEMATFRSRHRDHFVEFGQLFAYDMEVIPDEQTYYQWLEQCELDHENLRAAIEWTLEIGEPDPAFRLIAGFGWFMTMAGRRSELFDWFDRALEIADKATPLQMARAMSVVSVVACFGGDVPHLTHCNRAIEIFEEAGIENDPYYAIAFNGLGNLIVWTERDPAKAAEAHRKGLEIAKKVGSKQAQSTFTFDLAIAEANSGNFVAGREALDENLRMWEKVGHEAYIEAAHWGVGMFEALAGNRTSARKHYEIALPQFRRYPLMRGFLLSVLSDVSRIALDEGDAEAAGRFAEEGLALSSDYSLTSSRLYASLLQTGAILAELRGDTNVAREMTEKMLDVNRELKELTTPHASSEGTAYLGHLSLLEGNREAAKEFFVESLRMSESLADAFPPDTGVRAPVPFATAVEGLAQLETDRGNYKRAARLLGAVDQWRKTKSRPLPAYRQESHDRQEQLLRASLSHGRFEAEMTLGRSLDTADARAYAARNADDGTLAQGLLLSDDPAEGVEHASLASAMTMLKDANALTALSDLHLAVADAAHSKGDLKNCEDSAHDALKIMVHIGDAQGTARCLGLLSFVASSLESYSEAARLLGAATALGWENEELSSSLKSRLEADVFDSAFKEGRDLSMTEAFAYASRSRGERKRPSIGWEALTPTELNVVELVAKGLTNPQIGEKLFISKRTVQAHLYRIFAKLGVESRAQLASEFTRRSGGSQGVSDA